MIVTQKKKKTTGYPMKIINFLRNKLLFVSIRDFEVLVNNRKQFLLVRYNSE